MSPARKATTEEIIAAYQATGSVWKAAKRLGMAGQTVHERLISVGYKPVGADWTQDEVDELQALYGAGVPLGEIAKRLGRPYGGVACKASGMGLRFKGRRRREEKIPRGVGFDKVSMGKHLRALEAYDGTVTKYARAHGLGINAFVQAAERHFPDRWQAYVCEHSAIPARECPYCSREYHPNSNRQQYCSRKCSYDARADREYFGGKRRNALGMEAGICQLCGQAKQKGLSAHHVLGKDNDPENDVLVALCTGCHKTVTLLASRKFVDEPTAWEALISLAMFRKFGGTFVDGDVVHVTVDIDRYREDEETEVEVWAIER